MTKQFNFTVSVLILREGDAWVAQGLEYDIAAQGSTIRQAKERFEQTFVGQICVDIKTGKLPMEGCKPAPRMYWEHFESAERLTDRRPFYLGQALPPAFMIQAAADDLRVYA